MTNDSVELRFILRNTGSRSSVAGPVGDLREHPVAREKPTGAARMLALAIHFDDMLERGEAKDYADLARLACISRERVSQIMKLRWLAPELQKCILAGACLGEREIRSLADILSWAAQRQSFDWIKANKPRAVLRTMAIAEGESC